MLKLLMVLLLNLNVAYAAERLTERILIGTWSDKEGEYLYSFKQGYDLEYVDTSSGRPYRMFGVWMFGEPGTCSTSREESGKTVTLDKGNLMLYANTTRCCFKAMFVGSNLLLQSLTPDAFMGVCKDHVLVRRPPL